MMCEFKISSVSDPKLALHRRQFTLRHFFALVAICSVVALGYTWFKAAIGPTEFLTAAKTGDLDTLRKLIHSGVDVHHRDCWHTTALMLSASYGHLECVRFLIENGADPNERARFNATPLIWAVESREMEIVKLLIENGVITTLADDDGLTSADHARQNGHNEIADFIETQ